MSRRPYPGEAPLTIYSRLARFVEDKFSVDTWASDKLTKADGGIGATRGLATAPYPCQHGGTHLKAAFAAGEYKHAKTDYTLPSVFF